MVERGPRGPVDVACGTFMLNSVTSAFYPTGTVNDPIGMVKFAAPVKVYNGIATV